MAPAVTTLLDRALFPGLTAWDVFGNSHEPREVSNRAGSPSFGCKRSPQQAESLAAAGDRFHHITVSNCLIAVFDLAEVIGLPINRVIRPTGNRIKGIISGIDSQTPRRLLISNRQPVVPLTELLVR